MKKILYIPILLTLPLFIVSCDKDDDDHGHNDHDTCCQDNNNVVVAPDTYNFTREGESTVSYSGQTCRLEMAHDIYNSLNDPSYTTSQIMEMFDDGTGFPIDNSASTLSGQYECGKNVGSKTAASSLASSTVKSQFDDMIIHLVDNVYPNWTSSASEGVSGQITTSSGSTYQVDGKGLEVDQAFIKGLIGALCVDQITNNYLTPTKLDGDGTTNDTEGLAMGEYTSMEHYWDEGFGYLYGRDDAENPVLGVGVLLNKYLKKVNESNEPGIATEIYDAFKLGRAAIVAGDYDLRDEQSQIISEKINKIIAYKAIDYLTGGAETISSGAPREDSFHGLSEGYGFVLSLQFTGYFSNVEVNSMLDQMMEGNGFWDITSEELNSMASQIQTTFGL